MTTNRIFLAFFASLFFLSVPASVSAQDDFFGDESGDTSTDDGFGSDDDFSDEGPSEEEAAAMQEKFVAAIDGIRAAREANDIEQAKELLQAMSQEFGTSPSAYIYGNFEMAMIHRAEGNDALAQQIFSDLTVSAGGVPEVYSASYVELGKIKLDVGNYLEAIEDFTEATSVLSSNPEAHHYLGRAQLLQVITSPGGTNDPTSAGGLRSAMKSITKAIELKPDYGEAYLDRGRVLLRLRQTKYAVTDHEKAVQFMGETSSALGDLALTYRASGSSETGKKGYDQPKAIAEFNKAISTLDTYLKNHNVNKARDPWETTSPLDISPHSLLLARAETKINLGDETSSEDMYRSAITDCDRYLALDHINAGEKSQGRYTKGLALRMLNRLDEAKQEFTTSIEQAKLSPQSGYAGQSYLRRGIILFRQGNYDQALQDFERATYASSPVQADPRAMLWTGLCYAKKGELHAATRAYTTALVAYRDYVPAYMNRGLAHMKTGRYAAAYDDFNRVILLDPDNKAARRYRDAAKQHQDQSSLSVSL